MDLSSINGVDKVLQYDNIAIVVMFVIIIFQWIVIGKLLNVILKIKDVLQNLAIAVNELNVRLNNH